MRQSRPAHAIMVLMRPDLGEPRIDQATPATSGGTNSGIKLAAAIQMFQQYGFLKTANGETHFAFVHGNFGLDNGNGPTACGVNRELALLRDLGCFADFTFPAIYQRAQPPIVNSIYAAKDDEAPRSYRRRFPLSSLKTGGAVGKHRSTLVEIAVAGFLAAKSGAGPGIPIVNQRIPGPCRQSASAARR